MRYFFFLCVSLFVLASCSEDEKVSTLVLAETTNGAFIRTIEFQNSVFITEDLSQSFRVLIEEQDEAFGGLLERVELFVQFIDNTPEDGNASTEEVSFRTLLPVDFYEGPFEMPRHLLEIRVLELTEALEMEISQLGVSDQFEVRLEVFLTTGKSFSVGKGSNCIVAYDTFYSSPYSYTINIVERIPEDIFTGVYRYESVEDGPFGPTFGDPHLVTISSGVSSNVREIRFQDLTGSLTVDQVRVHRFTIAGNSAVFRKNQLKRLSRNCGEDGQPVMLIPDSEPGFANIFDDAVFELRFQELPNGGAPTPARIRFSKE